RHTRSKRDWSSDVCSSDLYQPPNIRKARKRFREDIKVHYDFDIPEDMQNIGKGKKYLIQTYGCQMNEHDTEVMAGILTNMGYEEIGRASCRERVEIRRNVE